MIMNDFFFTLFGVFLSFSNLVATPPVNDQAKFIHALPLASNKEDGPILKSSLSRGVATTAQSAMVLDVTSGKILYAKGSEKVLPIASLTKLISSLVLSDLLLDWTKPVIIAKEDRKNGNKPNFYEGDTFTPEQLLSIALIGSDNDAIAALVRASDTSEADFVKKMNQKAMEVGLKNSRFVDPTGLDPDNSSTAEDVLALLKQALSNDRVRQATSLDKYLVRNRRGQHFVYNTNILLHSFLNEPPFEIIGGKTGFIDESGYNLALSVKNAGHELLAIVLGSKTSDGRFNEIKSLLNWALGNYQWPGEVKAAGL